MTVHTTYFGALGSSVNPDEDDAVLAVARYPRDFIERVTDRNIPALAPPDDLLDAYKSVEKAADRDDHPNPSAVAWDTVNFETRYHDHLSRLGQQQVLDEIRAQLRDHVDVWLVCWEKDPRYCHRRLLADVLVTDSEVDVDVEHIPAPSEFQDDPEDDLQRMPTLRDFQEASP